MSDAIATALAFILTWEGLTLLVLGTVIGTVVAIIPGLGSPVALAVLLPVTFAMSPEAAFLFLLPIIGAGGFAGSMTAILVGVPGDETNAATVIDGHALARQGRAGEAIGASATASALGALFGVFVLVVSIPLLRGILLKIGPPEVFAMTLIGLMMVGMVSAGRERFKGVVAGFLGVSFGLIGFNFALGGIRFTMGVDQFVEGIPLVPALIGLFAIPEAVSMVRDLRPIGGADVVRGGVLTGVMSVLRRPRLLLQSSVIGTGIGLIPGVGGSIACWIAYFAAKRTSKDPDLFGHGSIEGVIGPEAAIDAKDGGQLMPLLALGLPGGITTAILAGAFLFHGIQPGYSMFTTNLHIVYLMVFALIFSNVSTSLLGLAMANVMLKVTMVRPFIVAPLIVSFGIVGSYVATVSFYGPVMYLAFGAIGYFVVRGGYSRAAIVVGLILLPIIEKNLHISLQLSRGSLNFLLRPATFGVFAVGVLAMFGPSLTRRARHAVGRRQARDKGSPIVEVASEGEAVVGVQGAPVVGEIETVDRSLGDHDDSAYSQRIDLIFAILATAWGLLMLVQSLSLPSDQRLVPLLVLPILVLTSIAGIVNALRIEAPEPRQKAITRRDALAGVALVMLLGLIWAIGLFIAVFVWSTIAMLGFAWRQRWSPLAMSGLVFLGGGLITGLYFLVAVVLDVRLPNAALF